MNIPYRTSSDYTPVDIARLRPAGSYAQLLASRTHATAALVRTHGGIPPDLLLARDCPTCGSNESRHELDKDHLSLVRCQRCDLVYVAPVFDEDHYRSVYASPDYQRIMQNLGEGSHDYRVERFGRERIAILQQHLDAGAAPAFLDVGCSTGFVVEAAASRGWRAVGIDLNPSAVRFGQARGLDLRVQSLEDLAASAASFDAIGLFDVLEHLLHPRRTLDAAIQLLKPRGLLFLYVPNYDSASRFLMGGDAHFIWPTHHLNYYTPLTLVDLMARSQLSPVMTTTEGLDIVDYLWQQRELRGADTSALDAIADRLQFFINAGGYGKNLRVLARKA